jgi:prophage regulatory protein
MMHAILRLPDVKRSTGLSRSTIYLRITQGAFPKPVSLGGRRLAGSRSPTVVTATN